MQIDRPRRQSDAGDALRRGFHNAGLVFSALGVAAMLAPSVATLVVEQLVAWVLVLWGLAGLVLARSFRGLSESRIVALFFAAVLVAGIAFVAFPGRGAAFITAIMIVVFLAEGMLSILLGLRLSGQVASWRWIIASGVAAFGLGIVILLQWPSVSAWILGFLTGLNFLSTGMAMLLIARPSPRVLP